MKIVDERETQATTKATKNKQRQKGARGREAIAR